MNALVTFFERVSDVTLAIDKEHATVLLTAAHPDIADVVGKSFYHALRVSREGDNDFKVRNAGVFGSV